MAIQFDESNDYYSITDAAELTLQDGDWCVGIWTFVSDNTGTNAQCIISTNYGAGDGANQFSIWLTEASATDPNKWSVKLRDGGGDPSGVTLRASATGADNKWWLVIAQRVTADNELQLWLCEPSQTASKEDTNSDAGVNAINGSDWNIGRRSDSNRYYGSIAAVFFKGDFSLSQTEIEALAKGHSIQSIGKSPDVHLRMFEAGTTLTDLSSNGNDATRQDAPTTSTHPPVMTPAKRRRM